MCISWKTQWLVSRGRSYCCAVGAWHYSHVVPKQKSLLEGIAVFYTSATFHSQVKPATPAALLTLRILLTLLVLKSFAKMENRMFLQTPGLLTFYMTSFKLKKIKIIKYRHQQCIASVCVTAYIMSFLISGNLEKSTASKMIHSSNLAPRFKWVVQKSNASCTFSANFV